MDETHVLVRIKRDEAGSKVIEAIVRTYVDRRRAEADMELLHAQTESRYEILSVEHID